MWIKIAVFIPEKCMAAFFNIRFDFFNIVICEAHKHFPTAEVQNLPKGIL